MNKEGVIKIDRISSTSGSLIPVSRKVKKCDGKLRNGYRCGLTYPNVNFYRVDVITTEGEKWDLDGVGRNGGYKARSRTI